jgi:hypothetical protein
MNNSEQNAAAFMEFCSNLPGFNKSDFEKVSKGIQDGKYQYDATDHIVVTPDGWRIQIHSDGRFIPLDES